MRGTYPTVPGSIWLKVSHIRPRLPASGAWTSGSGLVPLHWHFSHPVCFVTGPRITEVSLSEYQMTELFSFQGPWGRTFRPAAGAAWEIVLSLGSRRKWSNYNQKSKLLQKNSDFHYSLMNCRLWDIKNFRNFALVVTFIGVERQKFEVIFR